ncbi:MAG: hypothetical protein RLZZ24_1088 [Pseudomonadota bacterium]|jgi:hypothetical protein
MQRQRPKKKAPGEPVPFCVPTMDTDCPSEGDLCSVSSDPLRGVSFTSHSDPNVVAQRHLRDWEFPLRANPRVASV